MSSPLTQYDFSAKKIMISDFLVFFSFCDTKHYSDTQTDDRNLRITYSEVSLLINYVTHLQKSLFCLGNRTIFEICK